MKIKDQGAWIEFNVVMDVYKDKEKLSKDADGNKVTNVEEVFVKEVLVPTSFLKDGISLIGTTINNKNQLRKTRTAIYDTYTQRTYVVKHTRDQVQQGLINKPIIGFQVGKTR